MPIVPLQTATNSTTSSTQTASITATFPAAPTPGNLMVIMVICVAIGGTPVITTPAGWTQVETKSGTDGYISLYDRVAVAADPAAVTVSKSATTGSWAITMYEFPGMLAAPLDVHTSAVASSVTSEASGTTGASTQAYELQFAGVGIIGTWAAAGTPAWTPAGFVKLNDISTSTTTNTGGVSTAVNTVSATGTATATAGWTNSVSAAATVIATFKASVWIRPRLDNPISVKRASQR